MEKIHEQLEEVRHYFGLTEDALKEMDVDNLAGWAKALREEAETLEQMATKIAEKVKKTG